MNEQVWQYANKPDWNLDVSMGQALPNEWGGIVVGYSYAKVMTAVPAIRPWYSDEMLDAKLTLTPTDAVKFRFSYMIGQGLSVGAGSGGVDSELQEAGGGAMDTNDPVAMRTPGSLIGSVNGLQENNKLNMAYNSRLNGDYWQLGASATVTFGARTFLELGLQQAEYGLGSATERTESKPRLIQRRLQPAEVVCMGRQERSALPRVTSGSPCRSWTSTAVCC